MVDGMRRRVWERIEVRLTGGEGSGEDDGVDILYGGFSHRVEKKLGKDNCSLGIGGHKVHARKCS